MLSSKKVTAKAVCEFEIRSRAGFSYDGASVHDIPGEKRRISNLTCNKRNNELENAYEVERINRVILTTAIVVEESSESICNAR